MHKEISSLQNPLVKQMLQLIEKSRERRKSGLFVIEGQREVQLALKGGYTLKTVLICTDIIAKVEFSEIKDNLSDTTEIIEISGEVYQKLSYRTTTEGILAISQTKDLSLNDLDISTENPLILIAEALEKPGNIGALLRTADAADLDAVIFANPKTDMYNPNILRSSVGCLFTNSIATGSTTEIIAYLKEKNINIYCAALQGSIYYHDCDFTGTSAIVMGTEDVGLSLEWLENSTENIIIPMQGEIDSLNVSVAAGIIIFEAKRQRGFN
jgi:RNA methyltransferase, TrmH family